MSVRILVGDCRARMAELDAASIDSCVCDPPYHLTSIVKRFGAANAAPAKVGKTGAYARASRGFMGQTWDGGDVAFRPETWAEVLRVLKPGAHLVAFSGTRTYHRMACAIEDAGFEIRDQLAWCYATGFPKSHNQPGGWGTALKPAWEPICLARKPLIGTVAANIAKWGTGALHIEACRIASPCKLCGAIDDSTSDISASRRAGQRSCTPSTGPAASFARGPEHHTHLPASGASNARPDLEPQGSQSGCPVCRRSGDEQPHRGAAHARDEAPSHADVREPRGPQLTGFDTLSNLSKPCADAINIDAKSRGRRPGGFGNVGSEKGDSRPNGYTPPEGRWPANIIHDGSDEVLAAFPDSNLSRTPRGGTGRGGIWSATEGNAPAGADYGDTGSAARFFYAAKATTEERGEGNDHPTVKPIDLMRWLCRLVTPKGGTVLDPFAGSGSTLIAADMEQFDAIGCELSPDYAAIAERRVRQAAGMFAEVQAA